MRKVKLEEVQSLADYEKSRDAFRARMIAHKKIRRVLLGPEMSLVFEDHDTNLMQIQEMCRAERISDPSAVQGEIDVYNELVPPDGALLATMMIELEDAAVRERRRREYLGIEKAIALEIGDQRVVAEFAPEGLFPDRVAVVQFLTFRMPKNGREMLLDGGIKARLVCTHERYDHAVELSDATRRSLANDLDPANAASAAR